MSPKIHIYLRHFVHDKKSLRNYSQIIKKTLKAKQLANFNFNAVVNYDPALNKRIKDKIVELSEKLVEADIGLSVKVGHGAGSALFDSIEETLSNLSIDMSNSVIIVIDGDTYAINKPKILKKIKLIANVVVKENAILGLAQRTTIKLPVKKPSNSKKEEMLREIDELYLALALKRKIHLTKSNAIKLKSYKELGDPVPGFYCINITHKNFPKFFKQIEKDVMKADVTKYTGDFYMVLAASKFGKIISKVIPVTDNPTGSFSLDMITQKSKELSKTTFKTSLLKAVKSRKNKIILEKFYPSKYVEKVQKMILKGLTD